MQINIEYSLNFLLSFSKARMLNAKTTVLTLMKQPLMEQRYHAFSSTLGLQYNIVNKNKKVRRRCLL